MNPFFAAIENGLDCFWVCCWIAAAGVALLALLLVGWLALSLFDR